MQNLWISLILIFYEARCMYVNIGVKRSVRTSGVQPTILNILQNCVQGQKLKYTFSGFFLCIFQNFICIFSSLGGGTSWPPRNLKFLVLLIVLQRNGISLSANLYLTLAFFGPPQCTHTVSVRGRTQRPLNFLLSSSMHILLLQLRCNCTNSSLLAQVQVYSRQCVQWVYGMHPAGIGSRSDRKENERKAIFYMYIGCP